MLVDKQLWQTHLPMPDRVDGVADDPWPLLLAVVGQGREGAVLAGLDGDLQVWVRVEEHPLLQSYCLEVWERQIDRERVKE